MAPDRCAPTLADLTQTHTHTVTERQSETGRQIYLLRQMTLVAQLVLYFVFLVFNDILLLLFDFYGARLLRERERDLTK